MSYCKTIDGKNYDGELIELAEKSTYGNVDGRLSKADAEILIEAAKDVNSYTNIEKDTMAYIRENFKWTNATNEWLRDEIRKWAASK